MTPIEQLMTLRAETAAELEQLLAEVGPARVAAAEAERQVEALKVAHSRLKAVFLRGVGPLNEGLAPHLWRRLEDARQELIREIAGVRGSLPSQVKLLEERIAGCRLSLIQIDRALEPDKPRHVPEVVPRARPVLTVSPYTLKAG